MTDALEVRLLRWGESSETGRTVTFLLPGDGEHPFKGLRYGKKGGERFALALAHIADDEAKADHIFGETGYVTGSSKEPAKEKSEGAKIVQSAVMLCKDKDFAVWFVTRRKAWDLWRGTAGYPDNGEAFVADELRKYLCLESRSDLAVNPAAREKFLDLREQFIRRDQIR